MSVLAREAVAGAKAWPWVGEKRERENKQESGGIRDEVRGAGVVSGSGSWVDGSVRRGGGYRTKKGDHFVLIVMSVRGL